MLFQSYFDGELTLENVGGMNNGITAIDFGTILHIKSFFSYSVSVKNSKVGKLSFTESQLSSFK